MSVPPGISIDFSNDSLFTDSPTWTRIDNYPGIDITHVQITRGRTDERSKTNPGTVTISGMDESGLLDATNPNSPFYGGLDPIKQAAITLWNPNTNSWSYIFKGYVADYTWSFSTDLSKPFIDFQITLVDMLDLLNDAEVIPDAAGNMVPTENIGDCFYTGQHVDDRILAVLADTATAYHGMIWPVDELQIASGNVFVQGRGYSNGTAMLQVIDEACDAEGPYATNRFITKDGSFAFRGRYYRYEPTFYMADSDANRRENHRLVEWSVADVQSFSSGTGMAMMNGLTWTRGKTNLINTIIVTPANIRTDQIAAQEKHDSTSISKYGVRTSGMTLENLITDDGDDGNTSLQETNSFAEAYKLNYAYPVTRVSQIKITNPSNDTDDAGQNTWSFLTGIELSDLVTVHTRHPGGGGFGGVDHFVEQITYDLQPLRGSIWQVEMTLDLTPRAYYSSIPQSWNPPGAPGSTPSTLAANFDYAQ